MDRKEGIGYIYDFIDNLTTEGMRIAQDYIKEKLEQEEKDE